MKRSALLVICGLVVFGITQVNYPSALARPPYKKEFENLYIKKAPSNPQEKSLSEAVTTTKCNVCHQGKSKKTRNTYGQELAKILKKGDDKNAAKIKQALEQVSGLPSDPGNPSSPKFGDLIKEGKLPGKESANQPAGADKDDDEDAK